MSLDPGEERPWGASGGQYYVVMHGGTARLEDLSARLQAQQQVQQQPMVQEQPMAGGVFDLQGLVSNPLPIVLVVLVLALLIVFLRR